MLRGGVPADAEAIESIRIAAWRAAYKEFMSTAYLAQLKPVQNIKGLRERLSSQSVDYSISVAEENNIVLAFSILGKPRYESSDDTIELWCIKGNRPAEATYGKAGFLPTGKERTSSKLTGNPIHEWHYIKNL